MPSAKYCASDPPNCDSNAARCTSAFLYIPPSAYSRVSSSVSDSSSFFVHGLCLARMLASFKTRLACGGFSMLRRRGEACFLRLGEQRAN